MGAITPGSLHTMSFVAMLWEIVGERMHFPFDEIR